MGVAVVALAVFLRRDPQAAPTRLVVLGVLTGLAVLAKQNTGIYLGGAIAALLLWPGLRGARPLREITAFAAGVAGVAVPAALYFASEGLLGQMIFSGFVRPFTGYLPTSGVSLLPPLAWWEFGQLREGAGSPYLPILMNEMIHRGLLPGASEAWSISVELFSRVVYLGLLLAFAACGIQWWRGRRDPRFVASACICLAIAVSAFALRQVFWICSTIVSSLIGLSCACAFLIRSKGFESRASFLIASSSSWRTS